MLLKRMSTIMWFLYLETTIHWIKGGACFVLGHKWISGSPPTNDKLRCKVRHGLSFHNCSITTEFDQHGLGEIVTVHLSEDDQGLAADQFAAFYDDNICIGSGVILESWDVKSFHICNKALEIAQLKDKSKLGKPVRIMNLDPTDCKS